MAAKALGKTNHQKYRLLFEEHPQPMWLLDPRSQTIVQANAAAATLYGYTQEEFRGMPLAQVEVSEPGRGAGMSRHHRTKSGRDIEVDAAAHGFEYGHQPVELVVLMDVTEQRYLEEQLRQARKMEAVGMLAGGVAHDFNNLLTIITGYSQLILNNLSVADPNHASAEQIMKAADRAAGLTRQLLAFSRRQVVQPKVLDLNRLIGALSTMLRRLIGEHIDLRLNLSAELGQVSADPGQIEQVLMNLVVNARDAMPDGGTLTIATSNASFDKMYSARHISLKPGRYSVIEVTDTGVGMDEATQARLFEPFFTTKDAGRGTGLGLSTVSGIVKQRSGGVEVHSDPDCGTTVRVYLPRIEQPVTTEAAEVRTNSQPGTETILLVEDDEMVRHLVRDTLTRNGYKVLDAPDPLQARRVASEFGEKIHLLITDMVLPKGSGRKLASQLVKNRPDLSVMYMSGYSDGANPSGLLPKKVTFLQKPFTPGTLIAKVREVLEVSARTRGAV